MIISNEVKSRFIDLSVVESVNDYYPSYKLVAKLVTENITCSLDNYIWICEEDLENFISGLENLDKTRNGRVGLQSMSPDAFNLVFSAIDNHGHLSVELHINKEGLAQVDYSFGIRASFQVDSTILPSVIKELKRFKE